MAYPAVGDAGTNTVSPPNDWASKLLATLLVHSDSSGNLVSSFAKLGTNPASAGTVRINNTGWIASRNAANSGDVNLIRADGSNRLQVGAQVYRNDDGLGFGDSGSFIQFRRVTNLTSGGIYPMVDLSQTTKGTLTISDRVNGIRVGIADAATVVNKTITNMTRVGTTVTVTANGHGFANGDRIAIYGVTSTFDQTPNGSWTAANVATNTFEITIPALSSGTYTSGGTVTNRGMFYGINVDCNPSVGRGGLTGTAAFADDVACYVGYNGGTGKGTDAYYLGRNATNFPASSEWATVFTADCFADYGIRINGTIVNAAYEVNGSVAYGIDLKGGTYSQAAIRLKNNTAIVGRKADDSANVPLVTINTSNEVVLSTSSGSNVVFPGGVVVRCGDSANFQLGTSTGTAFGTGSTQKLAFWGAAAVAQHNSTGETVGFTAGGGTTVTDASTFTGNTGTKAYRISDIVKALKLAGIMASS